MQWGNLLTIFQSQIRTEIDMQKKDTDQKLKYGWVPEAVIRCIDQIRPER